MWGKTKKKSKKHVTKFSFSTKSKSNGKRKSKGKRNQTKKAKKKSRDMAKKSKQMYKKRIQRGKGKYLTAVPSEYYDTKNRVSYMLEDSVSKFQGNVRPIDPNPTYQNFHVSKFDISPPTSLLEK